MKRFSILFALMFMFSMLFSSSVFAGNRPAWNLPVKVNIEGFDVEIETDFGYATIEGYSGEATEITLPTSLIYEGAEYKCDTVEDGAFKNNSTARKIIIPEDYWCFGEEAFYGCSNLEEIVVGNGMYPSFISDFDTNINNAFANCPKLKTYWLGDSLKDFEQDFDAQLGIGQDADNKIMEGVTAYVVRDSMFDKYLKGQNENNPSENDVNIEYVDEMNEGKVTNVIEYDDGSSMKPIPIPPREGDDQIHVSGEDFEFDLYPSDDENLAVLTAYNGGDLEVELPAEIQYKGDKYKTLIVGGNVFQNAQRVRKVIVPKGYCSVSENAFSFVHDLTELVIADSVTSFERDAFAGCPNLSTYRIGTKTEASEWLEEPKLGQSEDGVVEHPVTVYAKPGSDVLGYIDRINSSQQYGASQISTNTDSNDPASEANNSHRVLKIDASADPPTYEIVNKDGYCFRVFFENNVPVYTWFVGYDGGMKNVTIPSAIIYEGQKVPVVKVGNTRNVSILKGDTYAEQVIVPNGIKSIGEGAISGCPNLNRLILGNTITEVGKDAFADCPKMRTCDIGSGSINGITDAGIGKDADGGYHDAVIHAKSDSPVYRALISYYIKIPHYPVVVQARDNPAPEADVEFVINIDDSGFSPVSRTPYGPGAFAETADEAITKLKGEKDQKGMVFQKLKVKAAKVTNASMTLSWSEQPDAVEYVIYASKCGKTNVFNKLATKTGTSAKITRVKGSKLTGGTYYKYIVVALNSNGKVVSTSTMTHVTTTGGKYCNYKKVTTKAKNNKVTLKVKKTFALKGKAVKENSKKQVSVHRALKYLSTNTKIATVSAKGVIKGNKKGTCYIYAYAQNGAFKKIKVTVK